VVVEGHLVDDPPEPDPVPEEPEPDRGHVPLPREDPGRTETRGGAIYVLRADPSPPDPSCHPPGAGSAVRGCRRTSSCCLRGGPVSPRSWGSTRPGRPARRSWCWRC